MILRTRDVIRMGIIGALLIGVAACGSDDEAPPQIASLDSTASAATDDTAPPDADDASDEAALLEVAACMRSNGVADFPDPVVSADGTALFDFPALADSGLDPQAPAFRDAMDACRGLAEGTTLGGGPFAGDPDAQDRLLELAQCMRENGVPDFEDPQIGNGGPPTGGGGRPDLDDPAQKAAFEICQKRVNLPDPSPGGTSSAETTPGGGS
ncbi:MAG: hypothetical protein IT195_02730 [Microthrixaceae bacterium]|nr:hypothetical protein [Microthrixaceae bacterium]